MKVKPHALGLYLRRLRDKSGKTLREVASEAKISNSHLSEIENGRKGIPSADRLLRLAKVYKVSPIKMLTRAGKIDPRSIYPKIDQNPRAKDLIQKLDIASRDSRFSELVLNELRNRHGMRSEFATWNSSVRSAMVTLTNFNASHYIGAIKDPSIKWGKQAGRRKRSTPDEAKCLIAELYFLYTRCRTMYGTLHESCGLGKPKPGWV